MKHDRKRAIALKEKLNDIFRLHHDRTEYILSHQELVDKANYRKRSLNSKVSLNGIKKPICEDGILHHGGIEYKGGCWTRNSNGHECMDYINSPIRLLVATKDSNEGVEEYVDTTNLGVEWDIRNETLRCNNKGGEICIEGTFANTYMRIVCILMLLHNSSCSKTEILKTLNDTEMCRTIWENAPVARINMKKQPGKGSVRDNLLSSYIFLYEDVLKSQIELLCPTVIVNSAGKPGMDFFKRTYKGLRCIDEKYGTGREKWIYADQANNNVTVIDVYHFSFCGWNRHDQYYYNELINRLEYALAQIKNI